MRMIHGCRISMSAVAITGALLVSLSAPGMAGAASGASSTARTVDWIETVWVARTTVKAGVAIPATVTVVNRTNHKLAVMGCGGSMTVANSKVPNPLIVGTSLCLWMASPGRHVFRFKVSTTYQICGGSGSPACGSPPRMTPLPPGVYRTEAILPSTKGMGTPRPITIRLTD